MKRRVASSGESGFTKWELLIIVAVLAVLVGLLLPALAKRNIKTKRIGCVSNLKQIGLSFRMWANEWGEKFPWQLATANGGTRELLGPRDAFRHFLTISNDLSTPKILACSSDTERTRVFRWEGFTSNKHLSYFIGLDADETRPQTILSGDRSISTNAQFLAGLVLFKTNSPIQWVDGIHGAAGNVALGDGSVQQFVRNSLANLFAADTNEVVRLLIP